ncbi:TetR/AcrR family transcriptional regulator [Polynucleobacter kasalickyi]|uniref:Transcriptional regulator, TetR family n=1 Tax=Polynucleobacter kasalickyi TaxID=1938817 RepID=A0A1W2BCQ8_9BURK|nr:TetR/AcrR family transcriptional regulator [Polynucleobacter kasalickyi]SMC70168.1 transcriptional regulator, TetR family [Polynucleobacter kasalickyi]
MTIVEKNTFTDYAKGAVTKATILQSAIDIAGRDGLEGITIGNLAERVQMSKSGVFAHFGSRDELLIEVIREYYRRFERDVFEPAISLSKGLPRLRKMIQNWIDVSSDKKSAGCFFISGAIEYDDRPSEIRDELLKSVEVWRNAIRRAIKESIDAGHLPKKTDVEQMLFQIYSTVLGVHHDTRFLKNQISKSIANKVIESLFKS